MNTDILCWASAHVGMFLKHSLQAIQTGLCQTLAAISAAQLTGPCAFSADDPHFYAFFGVSSQILLDKYNELHFLVLSFFAGPGIISPNLTVMSLL